MVQPSEHWHRDNLVRIRAGHARCWNRDTLTKALMRAARVDISDSEFSENAVQVPLPQDDHVIEAFLPNAAEKSLHDRVHEWRAYCRADDSNTGPLRHSIDPGSVLVVPVADDELRPLAEWSGIAQLGPMFV